MYRRLLPRGLKTRLVFLVACILMATGAVFGWVFGERQAAMLMDSLHDHALSLTASIGEGCAHYLLLREYAGLDTLLHASLKDNQLRQLQVTEADGLLVGEAQSAAVGSQRQPAYPVRLAPPSRREQAMRVQGDTLIVWRPIAAGSPLGWLRAVYDLSPIRNAQAQTWRDTLLLSFCWVIGSAMLLLLMLDPLTRIIGDFTAFAGRLNELKGEQLAATRGAREIVALAASLNEASSRLFASEQQRQQDQERLRLSEKKYRSLIHKVQTAIVVHAGDGRIIDSNPLARELLGLSADQLLGKELIDPEWRFLREDGTDMPVAEYPVSLVIATRRPLKDYGVGVKAPGRDRIIWVLVNAEPEFDEHGELQMVIVSFIDITARRRAEQALREKEENFRDLYENAPNAYLSVGTNGLIQRCNHRAGELLGSTVETLIGKPVLELYADTAQGKEKAAQVIKRFQAGQTVRDEELQMQKAHGDPVWVSLTVSAVRDAEGRIVESRSMVVDISERKRGEEEIRRLNRELEQRVADRTAQLQAANKELEAFAYSVSHDLRAPLRHIDGFLELLEKKTTTKLDEQSRHYMDTISSATQKMALLINDLLSFSRMGRQSISFKQVDLGNLVRDTIRELAPDTAGRTIDWRIGDLPVVEGDDALLRIVLVNLISNALKFTHPRERAQIEIESQPGKNSEAVIFIRDNGVGFDMTYADKLFGVFQRLHRADEFEGTGIGLASVRRIIARHGGRTWAKGEMDGGATFFFSLPRK